MQVSCFVFNGQCTSNLCGPIERGASGEHSGHPPSVYDGSVYGMVVSAVDPWYAITHFNFSRFAHIGPKKARRITQAGRTMFLVAIPRNATATTARKKKRERRFSQQKFVKRDAGTPEPKHVEEVVPSA